MKRAFSLAPLFFIFYFSSCENSNNKSTVINNVNNNLLTTIGDREITVNDFIKRCEYVPRPNYCKNNNYVHKKIALNSLIAEKLLAIEYDKKNLSFTSAQSNLITGRKEQSLRQMMLKKNGFDKVESDPALVGLVAKQIKKTYEISFLVINEEQKQRALYKNLESLSTIQSSLSDSTLINSRKITFNEKMPTKIKEILFFSEPQKNVLYGPISINKMHSMFFEINGWNTAVAVTNEQKKQAIIDAQKSYNELNALKIYEQYVSSLMRGKKLDFDPNIFQLFSNKVSEIYLIEKDKKESAMQNRIWDKEIKKIKEISSFNDLHDMKNQNLLYFDNKNYSVNEVLNLIKTHPLVFRNRKISRDTFDNELKYALADLFRDLEITKKAYKLNYDKDKDIINIEKKWKDFISSQVMKRVLMKGTDNGQKIMSSKIDSLQKIYSNIIKIDTDKFEKIKLTNIDLNVIYTNQAYPLFEPSFPVLTDDHLLDYGKKYNFN